jgi:hypothetical protein
LLLNVHLDDVSERRSAASVSNLRSAMEQTERLQRARPRRRRDRLQSATTSHLASCPLL